jgi:Spy/CpxP family protein refolding chaperone
MIKLVCAAIAAAAAIAVIAAEPSVTQQPTQEQVIERFREDILSQRADIMAKGLTLTAEQAAAFWPLFRQFQDEQEAISNGQIEATQAYSDRFDNLSDADALAYVNALLTRDDAMHDLRVKWLTRFQAVVPARIAARAIQLDRRLGQAMQVKISAQIPLVP